MITKEIPYAIFSSAILEPANREPANREPANREPAKLFTSRHKSYFLSAGLSPSDAHSEPYIQRRQYSRRR